MDKILNPTREQLTKIANDILFSPFHIGGVIHSGMYSNETLRPLRIGESVATKNKSKINKGEIMDNVRHSLSFTVVSPLRARAMYEIVEDLRQYAESGLDLSSNLEGYLRKNINEIYIGLTDEIVENCINESVRHTSMEYFNFLQDNDAEASDDYFLLFEIEKVDDRFVKKDKFDLELLMCLQAHVDGRTDKVTREEVRDNFINQVTRYMLESFYGNNQILNGQARIIR